MEKRHHSAAVSLIFFNKLASSTTRKNTRIATKKPFFTHSKLVLSSCSQFHAERKTSVSSVISQRSNNLRGQETSDSVGGRKSMCQIQATGAMEQQQIRLDIIASPAAGPCFGTRSNAMSTQTPGHLRTSKRISKDRQRRTFYVEDLQRFSYKNFL